MLKVFWSLLYLCSICVSLTAASTLGRAPVPSFDETDEQVNNEFPEWQFTAML